MLARESGAGGLWVICCGIDLGVVGRAERDMSQLEPSMEQVILTGVN